MTGTEPQVLDLARKHALDRRTVMESDWYRRIFRGTRFHRHKPDPAQPADGQVLQWRRSTAEQQIKEGKDALLWTRLSRHAFRHNGVRLQLHTLAYNLAEFMRTLALPEEVEHWSNSSRLRAGRQGRMADSSDGCIFHHG